MAESQSRPVPKWRLPFASVGVKKGAERSLLLLPGPSDLPGQDWVQGREQTWYTSRFRSDSEWVKRAGSIKSVTATRWFTNSVTHQQFTLSVYPLASEADALMAVNDGPTFRSTGSQANGQERVADDVSIPSSRATRASEQQFNLENGESVEARYLRGCKGTVLYSVVGRGCEHNPEPPSWSEMVSIAQVIGGRIAQELD